MKFLVKITGPKGYSKQGQVEADNRNQAEAEMYKQLRQAGMKGYKVKVLMTLNKDSALSVDEIREKYGVTQSDAVTVFGSTNGGDDFQSLMKTYGYNKNAGVMENKSVLFALNKRIEAAKMMIRDYKALIANLEKVRKTHSGK